jgi:RNA polymerase primary sigma factor
MSAGNSVKSYLSEVSKIPLLTEAEEKDLATRAARGDKEAWDRLVKSNLRFVVKIAKGYMNQGLSFEDLIQEGNIGLMEGVKRFDPKKGFRLTTYAGWWINLYVRRAIENQVRPIRLPTNKHETLRRIKAYGSQFRNVRGRRPTAEEIAEQFDLSPAKVEQILACDASFVSFEAPVNPEGTTLDNLLADPDPAHPEWGIYLEQVKKGLRGAMAMLSGRERQIIEKRFGIESPAAQPGTLRRVASEVGLSMEGVRRAEANAMKKLQRPGVKALIRSIISLMFVVWLSGIL